MAATNFDACLPLLLKHEGGYVNDPADPGGRTNLGVTQKTWEAYVGHPVDEATMRALTPAQVAPLYRQRYWDVTGCNDWPAGVDYMVFDCAVNQGPARAVRTLQAAAGVNADGVIGPGTRGAVANARVGALIDDIAQRREQFYRSLSTFGRFGKGWMNRLHDVTETAHNMDAGET